MQLCVGNSLNFEEDADFQQLLSLVPSLSLSLRQGSELDRFLQPLQSLQKQQQSLVLQPPQQQQQQGMMLPPRQPSQQQQQQQPFAGPTASTVPAALPTARHDGFSAFNANEWVTEPVIAAGSDAMAAAAPVVAAFSDQGPFVASQRQLVQQQQSAAMPCSFLPLQGTATSSSQLHMTATRYSSMACYSNTITTGIPAEENAAQAAAPAAAAAAQPPCSWGYSVQVSRPRAGSLAHGPTGSFDCFGLASAFAVGTAAAASTAAAAAVPDAAACAAVPDSPWIQIAMLQSKPSGMMQQQGQQQQQQQGSPVHGRKRAFSELEWSWAGSVDFSLLLSCSV
jgi:hypothetical protein